MSLLETVNSVFLQQQASGVTLDEQMTCLHCVSYTSKVTEMSNFCLQLKFDGVKVENVEVSKLYTYMETFEFSLGNTIHVAKEEDILGVNIHVQKPRLNHKPFTYKIEVISDKDVDSYVRVFLGPKANILGEELDLNELRHYFVEIDRFPYHGKFRQHTETICNVVFWVIKHCKLIYLYQGFGAVCSSKG